MKYATLFLVLLFANTTTIAQQTGSLYVTSYDDTVDIGYVCNGSTQNTIFTGFGLVDLIKSISDTLDSITFKGASASFPDLTPQYYTAYPYVISAAAAISGPDFVPTRPGDDTLVVTVHYNHQYSASGTLVFHTRESPGLALYGHALTEVLLGGSYSIGGLQEVEEPDTMNDVMNSNEGYHVTTTPVLNGGNLIGDQPVVLRSCGGATIDSIYEVGDFSEFKFDPFPTLPYTIPGDDSLVLNYEFTPQVVDKTGSRHHYLVFHSTDGHYLTWSFEYKVYPNSWVSIVPIENSNIRVFPNPVSSELTIGSGPAGTVRLFDLLGREVLEANDNGFGATLDVSKFESGTYFLRMGTQSAKILISH